MALTPKPPGDKALQADGTYGLTVKSADVTGTGFACSGGDIHVVGAILPATG